MKTDPKIASGAHAEAGSWGGLFRVAIVGATGAVGIEMIRCLEQRNFPLTSLRLFASGRSAGKPLPFRGSRDRQSSACRSWKRAYTSRPPCSNRTSAVAIARRQGR